jgi:glycosyltransferase involved in cell wall biosynthesis
VHARRRASCPNQLAEAARRIASYNSRLRSNGRGIHGASAHPPPVIFDQPGALRVARTWALAHKKTRRRVLTLTLPTLGFTSYAQSVRTGLARRDVETVHVELRARTPQKLLTKELRGEPPWFFHALRRRRVWRRLHTHGLTALLEAGDFDAVHVAPPTLGPLILEAHRRTGIRYSLSNDTTARLNVPLYSPTIPHYETIARLVDRFDREAFRYAHAIAPWSEWAAQSLITEYDIPRPRIVVVPPSIDPREVSNRTRRYDGTLQVVFVSNDWQRKGGPRLLKWLDELPNMHLHLVGQSPAISHPRVNVLGRVPRAKLLSEVLPTMDALALPTRLDMSPFAIVEAAATGLAVVASRLAGIPELVEDGQTGFLRDSGDDRGFIDALQSLPAHVDEMGRRARILAMSRLDARSSYQPLLDLLLS